MALLHILLGLLFSLRAPPSSAATDTISPGHALAGNDRLVSSNGKFALGFFQTGSKSSHNTLNSYLGIWFNKVPKLTPVWTANGDNPATDLTSLEFTISRDGNLVILDQPTKSIIWSTQANITTNYTTATLLNSGNLILHSSSNSSNIFWQSFDYPTDTLLAGAKIGGSRRLVSRKSYIDLAQGLYSFGMDYKDGLYLSLTTPSSPIPYDLDGEVLIEFLYRHLIDFKFFGNEEEEYFTYTLLDETAIIRFVGDVSGQSKIFMWDEGSQDWVATYTAPKQCDVPVACGPFTVCNDNKLPYCNCMKGFSVRSPDDWDLGDRTGGCVRNTPLDCSGRKSTRRTKELFYPMACVRLPYNAIIVVDTTSADRCAQVCLNNCSCTAYSYRDGGECLVWNDGLLNVKQQCGDGFSTDDIYLRLPTSEVRRGMIVGVVTGASVAALGLFLLILLLILRRNRRKRFGHILKKLHYGGGLIVFRYIDLQHATKNFSQKLGRGSFGSVFKGFLNDSSAIAVKRLDGARQGEKQFRAEVSSIGIIQHINLVKLIGFCCEGDRRLLVYEHMPNGSLDSHLFQRSGIALNWTIRYQIALGVARGLAYLHDSCRDCIIHCDIKPHNILLDTSFIPKVADFGMAKILGREFSRVVTTMRGTIGYLAPEWISGTDITPKVDVYSYGMVLFEIISGRRNSGQEYSSDGDHPVYFPLQVARELLNGDVGSLLDANLHGDMSIEEVERVCKVACWCIQDNEFDRPTMTEVMQFLEGLLELDAPPVPRLLHAIAEDSHSTSL